MISTAIQQLVNYGLDTGLILPDDEIYIRNQLLMTMQLDDFTAPEGDTKTRVRRPPPTGSTSSVRTPTTSAATVSSAI